MKIDEALKLRVHELAKKKKNLYTLSKAAKLGETTLNSFFIRDTNLSMPSILAICQTLNITLADFFDSPYFENLELPETKSQKKKEMVMD